MLALHDRLAAVRARREEGEKGFTLIELLVVVIIIGILAAIAIPIFLGQQDSSRDAAVQSDLRNAKTAVIAWQVDNPNPPAGSEAVALTETALGTYGFTQSDFTTFLTASVDPTVAGWSIVARSSTNTCFSTTATDGVSEVACPATGGGS